MMQKALNDFSVNVSTLTESCHGLLQGLEGCKVKEEISDLAARCDALNACTCDRLVILASVQDAGNQFNDSLDSFSVWVLSVDSRFAALEPHTVYADSIGKLILQLQVCCIDIFPCSIYVIIFLPHGFICHIYISIYAFIFEYLCVDYDFFDFFQVCKQKFYFTLMFNAFPLEYLMDVVWLFHSDCCHVYSCPNRVDIRIFLLLCAIN